MSKYDYEVANYCVEWDNYDDFVQNKKFDTEEEAVEFAKKKRNNDCYDDVRVYQERNIIGW